MTENGQKHVDKPLENAKKRMKKWLKMDENHVDKPFENAEKHVDKWMKMDEKHADNMWTLRVSILWMKGLMKRN